jgi:hypothetical protein
MTYTEIWNLRYASPTLKNRVTVAIAKASGDVLNEDPGTANHAVRAKWATHALQDAQAMAERMLWAVCSNATIQASGDASTDADLQFVVNSWLDSFAKAIP